MGKCVRGQKVAELVVHIGNRHGYPGQHGQTKDDYQEREGRQPESRVLADGANAILGFFHEHRPEAHQCNRDDDDDRPEQQLQKEQLQIGPVVQAIVQTRDQAEDFVMSHRVIPLR